MSEIEPKELAIPEDAWRDPGAAEVLRGWVVDGGLQISMIRAFESPDVWGVLIADIARHAARVYEREGHCSEADALKVIKSTFDAEWTRPTDTGVTWAQH